MAKKWYSFFVVADGEANASPEAAVSEPPRRVEELAPSEPVTIAGDEGVSGAATVAEVYAAARIEPPGHGFSVHKVADMLRSEHIQALPVEVKRRSVLVALEAAGVAIDEVIQDAVRRDRALDTYEQVLEQHVEQVRAAKAADNARLEEEIAARVAELRARIDGNNEEVAREQAALAAWRTRKQQEEAVIAETVGCFVTDNPITAASPAAGAGDADVR